MGRPRLPPDAPPADALPVPAATPRPLPAPLDESRIAADLARLRADGARIVGHSRATNTRRAQAADVAHFEQWCATYARTAMPASVETVFLYLTALANGTAPRAPQGPGPDREEWSLATIVRRTASLGRYHAVHAQPDPTKDERVLTLIKGLRREDATRRLNAEDDANGQKAPLTREILLAGMAAPTADLTAVRDRAILLVGFVGAMRRSEICALTVADAVFVGQGVRVNIRSGKADQEAQGRYVGLPRSGDARLCPVRALARWLELSGVREGPLFRAVRYKTQIGADPLTGNTIAAIVQDFVAAQGLDPTDYGGHSLRAGFATLAANAGRTHRQIMAQTGHASEAMVDRYVREANVFVNNPAEGLL